MLMGLGSLATIGVKAPRNLVVIVLDNGHYGETGMQASHTNGGVDLVGVAQSCGLHAAHVADIDDPTSVREMVHTGVGPLLLCVRVPVLVDGGIRRGTDIVKALALGAQAVLIGRPYVFGLAVGGALGVTRVIDILRNELELAMKLCGVRSVETIDQSALWL